MQQKIVFIFSSFIPLYGRLRRLVCPSFCIVCPLRLPLFSIVKWSVWPDWAIYWTLGYFLEPLATINLLKSPTFLGNFYKVVKIYEFWATFIDIWQFFSGHTESGAHHRRRRRIITGQQWKKWNCTSCCSALLGMVILGNKAASEREQLNLATAQCFFWLLLGLCFA